MKNCRKRISKMATGSIKHNIVIKDKKSAKALLKALEKASEGFCPSCKNYDKCPNPEYREPSGYCDDYA